MGRMHSGGKGISSSALPFRRRAPKWITLSPSAVVELIVKLAKKGNFSLSPHIFSSFPLGLSPSQIGVTLRDLHGIPQVRFLTGRKILRILKKNGIGLIIENIWTEIFG